MSNAPTARRTDRQGFTLIEMLVTLVIIMLLIGMVLAAVSVIRAGNRRAAARQLVETVALAASTYPSLWHVPQAQADVLTWDWNLDQILDGFPSAETAYGPYPATLPAQLEASGYRGFATVTGIEIASSAYQRSTGRIIDPWKRPLHVAMAAGIYGIGIYGIWSDGQDGLVGTTDDIRSWGSR